MTGSKNFRGELFDGTLMWNQAPLRQALSDRERHYNEHRTTDHALA
ncbi:hypothetical protein [Lentzea californiensis]|nr:hypothetical protein [Lentzea californiensis]